MKTRFLQPGQRASTEEKTFKVKITEDITTKVIEEEQIIIEEKQPLNVKILMLKGEKGDKGDKGDAGTQNIDELNQLNTFCLYCGSATEVVDDETI